IVTVGFALGEVTDLNAAENPDINWTMVDNVLENQYDNVVQNVYQTDEAAFLAGYLAAGMSKTGVLGTYGGDNFPTVSIFMDGFTRGAEYYNEQLDEG
ncbi:MAG: BMP family ABC transporter substrate-binding protein, partial [Acidimicrobiales bacterium]